LQSRFPIDDVLLRRENIRDIVENLRYKILRFTVGVPLGEGVK